MMELEALQEIDAEVRQLSAQIVALTLGASRGQWNGQAGYTS
jgi:hypothetical protein